MSKNSCDSFSKNIETYESIAKRLQSKFDNQNDAFVRGILYETEVKKMSSSIINLIEENSTLAYYYKLRILAQKQKDFFSI